MLTINYQECGEGFGPVTRQQPDYYVGTGATSNPHGREDSSI